MIVNLDRPRLKCNTKRERENVWTYISIKQEKKQESMWIKVSLVGKIWQKHTTAQDAILSSHPSVKTISPSVDWSQEHHEASTHPAPNEPTNHPVVQSDTPCTTMHCNSTIDEGVILLSHTSLPDLLPMHQPRQAAPRTSVCPALPCFILP